MNHRYPTFARLTFSALMTASLLSSCDALQDKKKGEPEREEQGPGSDQSIGYTSLLLKQRAPVTTLSASGGQGCHIGLTPTVQANGSCLSPVTVELWASGVFLSSSKPSPSPEGQKIGPGRLLGGGSGFARDGVFEGTQVDLAAADTIRGKDNLFHHYDAKTQFDTAGIETAYVRTAFEMKGKTWEMLVPFYDQPVDSITVLKECFDQPYIDQAIQKATLLPGLTFSSGDYLFCERTEDSKPCALTDFRFFDNQTKTLVKDRPASPKALKPLSGLRRACNRPSNGQEAPPEYSYGMPSILASLNQPVVAYADFSHGRSSKTNPDGSRPAKVDQSAWEKRGAEGKSREPHFLYFVESGSGKTEGSKLNVTLSFDTSGWIFANGITDLSSSSNEKILDALTTKSFFAWESLGLDALGGVPTGWSAELTLTASDVSLEELYQD